MGSNLARMSPTASRDLSKYLPGLQEPIFGPKISGWGHAGITEQSNEDADTLFISMRVLRLYCQQQDSVRANAAANGGGEQPALPATV